MIGMTRHPDIRADKLRESDEADIASLREDSDGVAEALADLSGTVSEDDDALAELSEVVSEFGDAIAELSEIIGGGMNG